jgi:hypothetical protein
MYPMRHLDYARRRNAGDAAQSPSLDPIFLAPLAGRNSSLLRNRQ